MKVLFISPPTTISGRYGGRKITNKKGYLPPLGLLQIASVLEEAGHEVKVLDMSVSDYPMQEFKNMILSFSPHIVCFTAVSINASMAFSLVKIAHELIKPLMVFGGPYAFFFSEKILKEQECIDVVVIGEGEYAMLEIANAVKNKESFKMIKGIAFRNKKNKIIKTHSRKPIANLDDLPFPSYHLVDLKKYVPLPHQYKKLPAINVVTSRGCPWGRCTFCFESIQPGRFRRMSPKKAAELVKMLVRNYGLKEISFWDDMFTLPKNWVYEFCSMIKSENLNIAWSCYAKVDSVDPQILKTMAAAGCWNIFFGIESGNQHLLDRIKKGITLEDARNAVNWCRHAGIETRGAFILGLPGETPGDAEKTIEFAMKLDLDYIQFGYATPYYGTSMHKYCLNEGTLRSNPDDYSTFKPVYLPSGYASHEELASVFKKAYRKVYLRPSYLLKKLLKIRSLNDISRLYQGFKILLNFSK